MAERNLERGQAIVLFVFAIIAMMGFAALAIDGGMLYSDRAQSQSVADASSLAGAGIAALDLQNEQVFYSDFDCESTNQVIAAAINQARSDAVTAAINRATSNGYEIDADQSDFNGVATVCREEDNGTYVDKCIDVTTQLSTPPKPHLCILFIPEI